MCPVIRSSLRARMLPHADQHYSMAPAGNAGDGLRLAMEVGASIEADNIGNAFWTPVSVMRTADGKEIRFPHLILDRQKPGVIAVNQRGKRFVNEATSYHEFVEAMHHSHETEPSIPAFLVCDANFLRSPYLGPIDTPPFYAVRVFPGDIGTAAGLKTTRKHTYSTATASQSRDCSQSATT